MTRCKTDCMMQYQPTECGAASLGTILRYYGRYIPLKQLRTDCNVGRDGSTAGDVIRAGEKYGLKCSAKRLTYTRLKAESSFPAMVFWKQKHWLVLEGFENNRAYLSDPAQGSLYIEESEFSKSYSEICLVFRPDKGFIRGGVDRGNIEYIMRILLPFMPHIYSLAIVAVIQAICLLSIAGLTAQFIDSFLQQGRLSFGIPVIWLTALVVLTMCFVQIYKYSLLRRIGLIVSKRESLNLFAQLYGVKYDFYITRMQGELSGRFTLLMNMNQIIVSNLIEYGIALLRATLVLIGAFGISKWLSIITCLVLGFNVYISYVLTERRKNRNKLMAFEQGFASGICQVIMSDFESIKASGQEQLFLKGWQKHYSRFVEQNQLLGKDIAYNSMVSNFSNVFTSLALTGIAGLLIIAGEIRLGALIAFQFLVSQIASTILQMPSITSSIQNTLGFAGRITDLASEDIDPRAQENIQSQLDIDCSVNNRDKIKLTDRIESVELENVELLFPGGKTPFLKNISIKVEKGQKVAIVGASGSGKTTVARMIAGLYECTGGHILINGIDRESISPFIINNSVGYVSQQVFVFSDSIENNITLWDPEVTQKELWEAIATSGLENLVNKQGNREKEILINSGARFSGGQRQQLEIARAVAKDPTILILDEATSALDINKEREVLTNLFKKDIGIISIAHRLTSARMSDYVYVMEDGEVIEEGVPDKLEKDQASRFHELCEMEVIKS